MSMIQRLLSSVIALPLLLLACSPPEGRESSLDPDAFSVRLGEGGAQLVDVRTAGEYAEGHIAGARNLDWSSGQLERHLGELDRSRPVLLYCASGRRSAAARDYLQQHGYTDIVDLAGGINAWSSAGKKIER